MKNKRFLVVLISLMLVWGFALVGCENGTTDEEIEKTPEEKTEKERWGKWVDPSSTTTLDFSVANDGVNTIIVGGIVETNENKWKANSGYEYTAQQGKAYSYQFEAWTESGTRPSLGIQYYVDNEESVTMGTWELPIDTSRKVYTVTGEAIPKGGTKKLEFQCADQTGTFYVKIISIETAN
jgi:hypothetical protein